MAPLLEHHIPAWKKLGLKLKSAGETPIESSSAAISQVQGESKKRKLTPQDAKNRDGKRTKKIEAPETAKAQISRTSSSDTLTSPSRPGKRKSVSFTTETKTEDGASAKELTDQMLAKYYALNPPSSSTPTRTKNRKLSTSLNSSSIPQPNSPVSKSDLELPSEPADTKSQKPKRQKSSKSSPIAPTPSIEPALTYLETYHTSRSTWKFSKAHQNLLFKHIFSPGTIPPSFEPALQSYLSGLTGTGVRTRLREKSIELIKEDEKLDKEKTEAEGGNMMEQSDPQRQQYAEALAREKARLAGIEDAREDYEQTLDPTWRKRFVKRKRAELILQALGGAGEPAVNGDVDGAGDGDAEANLKDQVEERRAEDEKLVEPKKIGELRNGGSEPEPLKKKRKRRGKARTGVPDDDLSTSSSSSSSDDSSSNDESSSSGGNDKGSSSSSSGSPSDSDSTSQPESDSRSGSRGHADRPISISSSEARSKPESESRSESDSGSGLSGSNLESDRSTVS
ncbi:hypothetical protein MMC20_005026 [Loxospora ochrophaea]|nr:hypothetical protein [Loxospora ochrophaea]